MHLRLLWAAVLAGLALTGHPATGAEPGHTSDLRALVEQVDQHIARRWAENKAEPAPRADDAEFLRRVYLDIAGRIPTVAQARAFLADQRPDKRARLVEQLLAGPGYVSHMTNTWRALLLPEASNNFQVRLQQPAFENWLKKQVARNAGYDQVARELLTASLGGGNPLAALYGEGAGALTFYLAKEFKPENLAASTARAFLGVSVECAQCHNHPFAEWKREQFWSFTAFFSGITVQRQMDIILPGKEDAKKHEIAVPGTDKVVQAKFLDGTEPAWDAQPRARDLLANWVTAPANPFFARTAVNRTWANFFGTGLVEPVDEMVGASSTSTHPELLDLLTREFVAHQFDVKFLIRVFTATRAYQLSSTATHKSQDDPTLFARTSLRGLSPEQLFDSVATATGYRDSGGGDDLITSLLGGARSARSEFLTKFARSERSRETTTSILQALSLMNGKVIASATALDRSETLLAIVDAPFLTLPERLDTLYLATLARKPEQRELDRIVRFVEDAAKSAQDEAARQTARKQALGDVFWALLNSPEFMLNH